MHLERVKGIEPSYSAWKAAALPLSYTRAQGMTYHATRGASTVDAPICPLAGLVPPPIGPPDAPLTRCESLPILRFPPTQRKEVIQCLLPSAVTSLGSPARLFQGLAIRALSAPDQRAQQSGRGGSNPAAFFIQQVIPGRAQSGRTRNLEIPGSRYARPGMRPMIFRPRRRSPLRGAAGSCRRCRYPAWPR